MSSDHSKSILIPRPNPPPSEDPVAEANKQLRLALNRHTYFQHKLTRRQARAVEIKKSLELAATEENIADTEEFQSGKAAGLAEEKDNQAVTVVPLTWLGP